MGERGIKRLITVFAEAMSRVASWQSRVSQAIGDDTKADGAMKNPISSIPSLNLHTFQRFALKYAKLKGNAISYFTAVYHTMYGKRLVFFFCNYQNLNIFSLRFLSVLLTEFSLS